jgi:arylsulfatase A-like enzyme
MAARALALILIGLIGCGTQPPAPASPASPIAPTTETRLVLAVVIDQLPSWVLERHLENLSSDGLIRHLADRGVYVERVAYSFANTNTAPGHAAIFTGAPPAVSGVISNQVVDSERGTIDFVDDGKHAVYGNPHDFVSPLGLRVPTVGDALKAQRGEAAQVVTLSSKDRAAVLSGGRGADLALWYEPALPGFTTSSYYGPLPDWLTAWTSDHPIEALLTPWEPGDPALLPRSFGADDAPGEGDLLGFGTTFPHDAKATSRPHSIVRLLPQHSEYLVDLARAIAAARDLGGDAIPDLLIVSISGTDYVGHTFGPESWEYLDHLIRADRALGSLYRELAARAPTAVLLTSDHGVHPLPEGAGSDRRVYPDEVAAAAEGAAETLFGPGPWIDGFDKPLVFFSPALRRHPRRDEATIAIAEAIAALWGIEAVFDVRAAERLESDPDPLRRMVGLSVASQDRGELYVLVGEGVIVDEDHPRGRGTTHGTPYPRDREVPVLFAAPGLAPRRIAETLAQDRVAPTLAALLDIAPPAQVTAPPLPMD